MEDTFDCPLVELGLIREVERGTYEFVRGVKSSLPDVVFIFALHDYWQQTAASQHTLSFETLLYGAGSPGGVFKLSENALVERLEHLPTWCRLTYNDTAGMRLVLRQSQLGGQLDLLTILSQYYGRNL
jgi:hypothetical protein